MRDSQTWSVLGWLERGSTELGQRGPGDVLRVMLRTGWVRIRDRSKDAGGARATRFATAADPAILGIVSALLKMGCRCV